MTYLGIDVGSERIGLAVSQSGIIAEPAGSFISVDRESALDRIQQEVMERTIDAVVVGLPYRRDGSLGNHGQAVMMFVEALRERLHPKPVLTVDEALTSKEAERLGGRRADHDSLAAALILEQYLREHSVASI